MPVFDKPLTVGELIEQLSTHDPSALVVLSSTHYGPDGVKGVFAGYIQDNRFHINIQWICDPADGFVPAVELSQPKPKH